MVFKIMKAASSFYAVAYNENKQAKGLAENVYFQNFGYLQDKSAAIEAASAFYAIDYNENKQGRGHAETIHHQNFPNSETISKNDIKKYLEDYSARNSRVKNPQFHAILSCKGNEHSFEELKQHALELMRRMGYGNNPMLIYEHRDTKNNHIHIVTSRVGADGKKINHDLEGKRANRILNEILKIDSKQNYQKALNIALSHNISTVAQFKLLMEEQGYNVSTKEESLNFYRHGTGQGVIPIKRIEEQIGNRTKDIKRTNQIKAFIHKYKQTHDPVIVRDKNPNIHTSVKPTYHSDLTNHLHSTFGIQFVFHGEKNKDPYGYTIIDHKERSVYKGGEIMKLEELCQPLSQEEKEQRGQSSAKDLSVLSIPKDQSIGRPEKERESPSNRNSVKSSEDVTITTGLSNLVSNTLREVESEANSATGKKKRKNQRRI